MSQSSVAVSSNSVSWVILNASPDLRSQFAASETLHPRELRMSPMCAVIVTNADIDHVAGLLTLREKTAFKLYATSRTHEILASNSVFNVLDPELVERRFIVLDEPFSPMAGLQVSAFAVPGKEALFLEGRDPDLRLMGEQTVGLRIQDNTGIFYYIPGCAHIPDWLVDKLQDANLVFFDGTVWEDDDMLRTRTGRKTGSRMGHVTMSGSEGSLARLAGLRGRRVYIHINNTNPVLRDSPERSLVTQAGWEIAHDGLEITL